MRIVQSSLYGLFSPHGAREQVDFFLGEKRYFGKNLYLALGTGASTPFVDSNVSGPERSRTSRMGSRRWSFCDTRSSVECDVTWISQEE